MQNKAKKELINGVSYIPGQKHSDDQRKQPQVYKSRVQPSGNQRIPGQIQDRGSQRTNQTAKGVAAEEERTNQAKEAGFRASQPQAEALNLY